MMFVKTFDLYEVEEKVKGVGKQQHLGLGALNII